MDTPQSDTDIKGVYLLPKNAFFGLAFAEQVASERNDIVYYELRRFFDLLLKNNPNILELLNTPENCILYRHEIMERIKPDLFISKLCNQTFAGYAFSQIKKARSLNKKIFNPMDKARKTVLDFCFVIAGSQTVTLNHWLTEKYYDQRDCALVNISHVQNMYALFHKSQSSELKPFGVFSGENANDVSLSSVPKGLEPLAFLSFNKDGYSVYCKTYKEYWSCVENRNENRYQNTLENGKNYDTKNMMHTFRLLNMAEEIATEQQINVHRKDREFLFRIKTGAFSYEELLKMASEKVQKIEDLFRKSSLPNCPDEGKVNELLVSIRNDLY
ncbi:putative nucleotidyltransferase [compost metagenome]